MLRSLSQRIAATSVTSGTLGNVLYKIVIPTLNAANDWYRVISPLLCSVPPQSVMIVDSDSDDQTVELARKAGFAIRVLARHEFNHGATRQFAADIFSDADILIYMTQDAVLASPDSIERLLAAFEDPTVGAAFGRQLPRPHASPIESHARLFNYGHCSRTVNLDSRAELGIKTIFISNSFAAYRRSALMEVGGFPGDVIFGEDTITAAKMLLAGWSTAYIAEATVYHSHSYTWLQEFRRYFDIGVLHSREPWLLDEFGRTGGEGRRFVSSELTHLWPSHARLIPSALVRNLLKLTGYRLGRIESSLGPTVKRKLSMHKDFWQSAKPAKLNKLKAVP